MIAPPPKPMQILIVDDAVSNLEVYKKILRALVDTVTVAFTSSAEALVWANKNEPDLILVDYNMPAPNGLEFIECLRSMPGRALTPIIMITASREKRIRHQALALGATDFLTKPADPIEFVARTRNLLLLRDAQKKLADHAAWLTSEVRRATIELKERERETIFQLLRVAEFRDNDTAAHIVRIGHLAALLAETLGLDAEDVELLRLAAPMHDIGKVATPDSILLKPGKLSRDEWAVMREHAMAGYLILKGSTSKLLQTGADIALTHHEQFNGGGYPRGLQGESIPLVGRITAVADVFDALTSDRPYKKAWSTPDAVERLERDSGSHFDPAIVRAFSKVLPEVAVIKARYADAHVV